MIENSKQSPNRIPIRFMDEEMGAGKPETHGETDDATPSAEELGRASIYEGETEMQRRIDRGGEQDTDEGRGQADDADVAGGPHISDLPESRNDEVSRVPTDRGAESDASTSEQDENAEPPRSATDFGGGPQMAELLAARAEVRRLEAERQKLSDEKNDLLDKLSRRQADFDNYRKRVERERGDTYNRIVGEVVGGLLPVIDNLRRALEAERSVEANESNEFKHFLQGIELINRQMNSVLENLGLQPVATVGEPFDPHVHEAIAAEESDRYASDTVIEEVVRGYRLGDKLLRPAMVKVAK